MPQTQLVQLDFSNLSVLDEGRIDKLLKKHIQNIAQDCIDRPGDPTARTMQLNFTVKPICTPEGYCENTFVEIECKSKVPVYRSQTFKMRVSRQGLQFNQDFPDEIDQQPLFGDDQESEAKQE